MKRTLRTGEIAVRESDHNERARIIESLQNELAAAVANGTNCSRMVSAARQRTNLLDGAVADAINATSEIAETLAAMSREAGSMTIRVALAELSRRVAKASDDARNVLRATRAMPDSN